MMDPGPKRKRGGKTGHGTVQVWRGDTIESSHRVHVVVMDGSGRTRGFANDPGIMFFSRSAIKPLQALPLVTQGGVERFKLTGPELALCCASHSGEPHHVDAARSILSKVRTGEDALACGPHAPYHEPSSQALQAQGREPRRVHNNCSGKHAGMLALAQLNGWPLAGYHELLHPVQQRMLQEVAQWTELAEADIPIAVDGCGVATFGGPLSSFAAAFARFATAARKSDSAPAAIAAAMMQHPEYVGGTGRLCTELMRAASGRLVVKVGAEGVYLVAVPGAELGIGIKVEDGAQRAAEPALLAVLRALSLLSDEDLAPLERFIEPRVCNTRGEEVGVIRADIQLEAARG